MSTAIGSSSAVTAGIAAGASIYGTMKSNAASAKQARASREFTERMRASAYQTTMKDMRAAGLNPLLAYQQGPTAIGGAAAMGQVGSFGDAASRAASAVASVIGGAAAERGAEAQEKVAEVKETVGTKQKRLLDAQWGVASAQEAQVRQTTHQDWRSFPIRWSKMMEDRQSVMYGNYPKRTEAVRAKINEQYLNTGVGAAGVKVGTGAKDWGEVFRVIGRGGHKGGRK